MLEEAARGTSLSLPFSASSCHLDSLACGPFLHLQSIVLQLLLPSSHHLLFWPWLFLHPTYKNHTDCIRFTSITQENLPISGFLTWSQRQSPFCQLRYYSQISEFRTCTYLRDHYSTHQHLFRGHLNPRIKFLQQFPWLLLQVLSRLKTPCNHVSAINPKSVR